jgi:predicted CxxxxCH...CXXCH cytochrome family protein
VYTDAGHLLDERGVAKTRAVITFGPFAATTPRPAERAAAPAYDADSQTCANVYCHGGAFTDGRATGTRPTWSGGAALAACGSCHGLPPANHDAAWTACATCHPRSATGRSARHLDGLVSVGDESGTCAACHPNPGGAHASHTLARRGLARALSCQECHVVPATVGAPGHLDAAPAEVYPAAWTPGLAARDGATPAFDGARCANVYCHGGGTRLEADRAPGIVRSPAWSDESGAAATCGGCHGVPPTTAPHAASMSLGGCAACHPSIDARGTLVDPAEGGTHLDGVVDVR